MFKKQRQHQGYSDYRSNLKSKSAHRYGVSNSRYDIGLASKSPVDQSWDDRKSLNPFTETYVPLGPSDRSTSITGGQSHHKRWFVDDPGDVAKYDQGKAIMKTTRLENQHV